MTRKLVLLVLIAAIMLVAAAPTIADWLMQVGIVDLARDLRRDFVTGTAITVIVVLLVLIPGEQTRSRTPDASRVRRWPFE